MSDSVFVGNCFIAGTTAVNCGGINCTNLTSIQCFSIDATHAAGVTLTVTDSAGTNSYTFSVGAIGSLLSSYSGLCILVFNLLLPITYSPNPVTVKLNSALTAGTIAVNLGFTN
jgi:hypothetical protein